MNNIFYVNLNYHPSYKILEGYNVQDSVRVIYIFIIYLVLEVFPVRSNDLSEDFLREIVPEVVKFYHRHCKE